MTYFELFLTIGIPTAIVVGSMLALIQHRKRQRLIAENEKAAQRVSANAGRLSSRLGNHPIREDELLEGMDDFVGDAVTMTHDPENRESTSERLYRESQGIEQSQYQLISDPPYETPRRQEHIDYTSDYDSSDSDGD